MKYKNKIILLINILCLPLYRQAFSGFQGISLNQDYNASQQATGTNQSSSNQGCPTPDCSQCNNNSESTPSVSSIPSFSINILGNSSTANSSQPILHTHQFNTPSDFNISTAILIVHIFPPSNMISGSNITYSTGSTEGTYTIAYTLKDPAGSIVHKEFSTALQLNSLPHGISITSSQTGSSSQSQTYAFTNFLPNISSLSKTQKQTILNGISPIIQKFGIQNSSENITFSPISGIYDSDDTQTTPAYLGITNSSSTATTGTTLQALTIALTGPNGSTPFPITFEETSQVIFNQADLANGLVLNVVIFPASNSTSYPIITTLRTIDGLKMRKKHVITNNPITFLPTTISIINGTTTATNLLTTSFLNQSITNSLFTAIGPVNLRFLITRPQGSTNFMVLMI